MVVAMLLLLLLLLLLLFLLLVLVVVVEWINKKILPVIKNLVSEEDVVKTQDFNQAESEV